MSQKRGKTLCPVLKENHANASGGASWTEDLQYLRRRTEKQWHNISRCFGNLLTTYELDSSSDCWIDLIMVCHCFSELWSFFPFSSETFDWRCRYTLVIIHINAITFFLCILNISQQHLLICHLCRSQLCLLNWIGGVQIFLIWYYGQMSSFMINPNGLYLHVPSHATEFELALALIFKTGSTLLIHHWQSGGVTVRQPLLIWQALSIQITLCLLFSLFCLLASSKRRNRVCWNRAYLYVRHLLWQTT